MEKDQEIADVIELLLSEPDNEIMLMVPKGSPLARSAANFHLLKRQADAAGKTVTIESVDDSILALAKESELEASHPLWRGVQGAAGGMSDIVPVAEEVLPEEMLPEATLAVAKIGRTTKKITARRGKKKSEETKSTRLVVRSEDDDENADEREAAASEEAAFEEGEQRFFRKRGKDSFEDDMDDEDEDGGGQHRSRRNGRRGKGRAWVWIAGIFLVVLLVLWFVTSAFGHAAIAIDFQKTPWSNTALYAADKTISAPTMTTNVIPGQVFTASKNTTQLYPASGSANVSTKAQGTLTIYNAYSSAAQELVAKTRFVTPDGKIFRLAASVTVPGAQVSGGKITPSSITATVVADQPGPSYNVGVVSKLTIPGFQGTPKYNGFSGALLNGASGGATGTHPVPTPADIANARTKVTALLQSSLSSNLTASYPNNFRILDGATNIAVTKLTVSTSTDANGNFSVFGQATLQAIGFDEAAFRDDLLGVAGTQTSIQNPMWKSIVISYSNIHADFVKGKVSFAAAVNGTLERSFPADNFKAMIEGKSVNEARAAIAAIPGLTNGKLAVWPMWLWSIPSNPDKIQITTN